MSAVPARPQVDADAVRRFHRCFPTGATIVTTHVDGGPRGLAVNAFMSVTLEPPLVIVCVKRTAATHECLFVGNRFAVNVLAHDQAGVAATFARSGGDKFRDLAWRPGPFGSPLLDGASASLEAAIERRMPVHTHTLFVGRVLDARCGERPPLIYLGGEFYDGGALQPPPQPPGPPTETEDSR